MTGRDLILYILANGLEDEPIFKNGTFIGFESESEYAKRLGVGVATVRTWAALGMIQYVVIGDTLYISACDK